MDKKEFHTAFVLSLLSWPLLSLLSGTVWYSLVASVLVYLMFIMMTMLMESDYDV